MSTTTKPLTKLTMFELAKAIEVLYNVKINLNYVGENKLGYELPQLLEANGIRITGAQEFLPGDLYHTTGIYRASIAGTPSRHLFPDTQVWECAAKTLIFKSTQSEDIDISLIKDALVYAIAVYGCPADAKPVLIGYVPTQNEFQTLLEAWVEANPPASGSSRWTGFANTTSCLRSELTTTKRWKELNPKLEVTTPLFVIYSPEEAACNSGGGYWGNNGKGWTNFAQAVRFTPSQTATLSALKEAYRGNNIRWMSVQEVETSLTKTAQELAARYGHTSADSNTTLKTEVNPDASDGHDEMMDLNVCGAGESAYFEWVTKYGDPLGDVFTTVQISDDDLPEVPSNTIEQGYKP